MSKPLSPKVVRHPRARPAPMPALPTTGMVPANELPPRPEDPREEVVKMSRLRQRIAQRLKEAQNTAAILTTYNEVDMTTLMELRSEYRDSFEKKHGVRLGFLSFFVKASILALQELPAVNAEVYGDQIVYKNYYDIGVAVGTPQGLVVPSPQCGSDDLCGDRAYDRRFRPARAGRQANSRRDDRRHVHDLEWRGLRFPRRCRSSTRRNPRSSACIRSETPDGDRG